MINELKKKNGLPTDADYTAGASATLATLLPRLPNYQLIGAPKFTDNKGVSRATGAYGSEKDHSQFVHVTINRQDIPDPLRATRINALKQTGMLTETMNEKPVTAYYMLVGNLPAARTYIPSKKLATVTVFVSDHLTLQIVEEKATSTDNVVELSKYFDIHRALELK
jgi:hypothetical protein